MCISHNSLKNLKVCDVFAGIGGNRLGFEKNGAKCVFSSEKSISQPQQCMKQTSATVLTATSQKSIQRIFPFVCRTVFVVLYNFVHQEIERGGFTF